MQKLLEKVFASRAQTRVVQHFLDRPKDFFNLSRIAKETGLAHSTIHRVMQPLVDMGLVKEIKVGQQIRLFMSGGKIHPLKNLTDMEKDYILNFLGDTPGIRKKLQDDRDKFPLGTGDAIIAAFEDFVAENGLNEDPQFKDGFEDHDYTTHYFDTHNQLVLGTIRRAGGDYLYEHIEKSGLLPELEEKMRDYVQKYTNPRKRPAKIQIIPYTNYQWNEDRYGEEL